MNRDRSQGNPQGNNTPIITTDHWLLE